MPDPQFSLQYAFAVLSIACLAAAACATCHHRFAQERLLRARAEVQVRRERLRVLRAQINPHFLFNALNSIVSASELQSPHLQPLVMELSALLRHTLSASEREEHSLQQELACVASYLRIQQIRRPARIHWSLDVEPACGACAVPSLVLLTLVENAIKHGLCGQAREVNIEICAERRERRLLLSVRNSCPSVTPTVAPGTSVTPNVSPGTSMGLRHIRERLEVYFERRAALVAHRTGPQQFAAIIDLPWRAPASTPRHVRGALPVATAWRGPATDRA